MTVEALRFGFYASGRYPEGMPEPDTFGDLARRVEAAGYDSIWAGDHLSTHNALLDGVVAMTWFAARTSTIQIGAGVLLIAVRHPGVVAKQLSSLDWLSGGRVVLGVGVGGEDEKDFEVAGVPLRERGRRTDDAIRAIRTLWSSRPASHDGAFYRFSEVNIEPGPARAGGPPVWVGGRSEAALRRAGVLGDGWLSYMASPRRFAEGIERVRAHAEVAGRDPGAIVGALMIPTHLSEDREEARRRVQHHLSIRYARPYDLHVVDSYCLAGPAEQMRDRLSQYATAGVQHFVLMPAGPSASVVEAVEELYEELASPLHSPGERLPTHDPSEEVRSHWST